MASYKTIMTNVGLAKLAQAVASGGTLDLRQMVVGDGNGNETTPDPNQSSLVRSVYAAQLNRLSIHPKNPNQLIAELVIPSDKGGFVIREVGLLDAQNTLVAVANFPATVKPFPAEGSSRELIIQIVFEVSDVANVQLVIDPTLVLATRQWCMDNFALAVLLPGGTTGQGIRKKSNADGDFEFYDPASGVNILVDSIEETQQLISGQKDINLSLTTTNAAVVYIDGRRLRKDEWTSVSSTQIRLTTAIATNGHVIIAQNEPLSSADFLRRSSDLLEIKNRGVDAQKFARINLGFEETAFLDAISKEIGKRTYPVGTIYTTTDGTDPAIKFGFGTWERYATGRALVGWDGGDADFNTAGKTGGAKTVPLTIGQMPRHKAQIAAINTSTSQVGDHIHTWTEPLYARDSGSAHLGDAHPTNVKEHKAMATGPAGAHTHTVTIPAHESSEMGGDQAHSNLQPYVVVFVWRRTA